MSNFYYIFNQEYPKNILCLIMGCRAINALQLAEYGCVLENALETALDEKERASITARYRHHKSLKQIAADMGITAEKARMIETRTLRKLRNPKYMLVHLDKPSETL